MRLWCALRYTIFAMFLTVAILIIAGALGLFTGCSFERTELLDTIEEMVEEHKNDEKDEENTN